MRILNTGRKLKSLLTCQKGVAAIETAIIGPFMLLLYFGMLDITSFMTEHRKITAISGSVADLVGQTRKIIIHPTSASDEGDFRDYFRIASMIMKPSLADDVGVTVTAYRMPASPTPESVPVPIWTVSNGNDVACVASPDLAQIKNLSGANKDVIVTQTCTKIKLYSSDLLAFFRSGKVDYDVESIVMISPRGSDTLDCYKSKDNLSAGNKC